MDQSDANLIKMMQQAFLTGGVGPYDQSPDLPTLGFSSMRQSAGLPSYPPTSSTHIKTPTPDQLIQEILERRDTGTSSSVYDPRPSSSIMETALTHIPMNWKGGRQSENIEDIRSHDATNQLERLWSNLQHLARRKVIPKGSPRQVMPLTASPVEGADLYTPREATPLAPTQDVLERLIMSDPNFWQITDMERPDMPNLSDFLPD
jgi:hypothetical protein